jgi:hypothetical protein
MWLAELTQAIQSIGSPWALTVVSVVVLLVGIRSGVFYTSPSRISEIMASQDDWLLLRFTTQEAVKNSVFYGAETLIAVMWDKWWLTGPLAVLMAVMALPTIFQNLVIAVTTIPVIVLKPRSIVPIVASTVVRFTGDALALLYLGLVFTALLT